MATCEALDDVPAQLRRCFSHELAVASLSDTARAQLLQVGAALSLLSSLVLLSSWTGACPAVALLLPRAGCGIPQQHCTRAAPAGQVTCFVAWSLSSCPSMPSCCFSIELAVASLSDAARVQLLQVRPIFFCVVLRRSCLLYLPIESSRAASLVELRTHAAPAVSVSLQAVPVRFTPAWCAAGAAAAPALSWIRRTGRTSPYACKCCIVRVTVGVLHAR